ncbi:VOC family protein [Dokdonella soli]
MLQIDHLILRVSDAKASARFYWQFLGLRHEGTAASFEVLRVNDHCTLYLLAESPKDPVHLAFCLDRSAFEGVRVRLQAAGVPFGGAPFVRDGQPASQLGARGWAEALYFFDPDQHNIEVRTHDEH